MGRRPHLAWIRAVKPGDNFFLYVNGNWLKTADHPARPLPDRLVPGFADPQRTAAARHRRRSGEEARRPALSPEEKKLRDLYDAFDDTAAIEANGLKPVQKDLDYLAGLQDPGRCRPRHGLGASWPPTSIYNIGIGVDDKNPDNYSSISTRAGWACRTATITCPDDKAIVETRDAYRKYLADMMTLAGMSDAEARADRILALETEIAKVSWNRADRRDEDKIYNPMPVSALKTLAPDFAWDAFLAETAYPADHARRASAMSSWRRRPPSGRWPPSSRPRRSRPGAII